MRAALLILFALAAQAQPPAVAPPPTPAKATFSLPGRVVTATGTPIAGAAVYSDPYVTADSKVPVTDKNGRFQIDGLPEGYSSIRAERQGYLKASKTVSVLVDKANPRTTVEPVEIVLVRESVVNGRVLNEDGEPLRGIQANLLQWRTYEGKRALHSIAWGRTNADGRFSIGGLESGSYIIAALSSVSLTERSGLREQYPTTFFPSTTDVAGAKPVEIASGAAVHLEDLVMHKIRMSLVSVNVIDQTGRPGYLILLDYVAQGGSLYPNLTSGALNNQGMSGPFVLTLPPGRFQLKASMGAAFILQTLDVADQDLSVTMTLPPVATVQGTVRVTNGAEAWVTLGLQSQDILSPLPPKELKVDDKDSFIAKDLGAGPYELVVTGRRRPTDRPYSEPQPTAYVRSLKVNGQDVTGKPFLLTTETTMEISLAPAVVVSGTVRDAQGKGARTTVVAWQEGAPEGALPRFVQADTGADGKYTLTGLPPGAYRILAFEFSKDGAPSSVVAQVPEFRQKFVSRATIISVGSSGALNSDPVWVSGRDIAEVEKATR